MNLNRREDAAEKDDRKPAKDKMINRRRNIEKQEEVQDLPNDSKTLYDNYMRIICKTSFTVVTLALKTLCDRNKFGFARDT